MPEPQITIFLSTPEAILFKEYQKYHDIFLIMQLQGVFNIQYGKAVLNFTQGELQNITKEEVVWKKLDKQNTSKV